MEIINRKAYHDYFILDEFEAGIELLGSEVKSVRAGKMNLKDSFIKIKDGEAFLVNTHISQYENASKFDKYDPTRTRKLLLHKREIYKLDGKSREKGMSVIPLSAYFNKKNILKLKIALVRGKHTFDKKNVLKERDIKRQMEKDIKKYS